jgi:arylsulfatase A
MNTNLAIGQLRWLLAAVSLAAGLTSAATAAAERPNVILIMADDFGYECVGANGSTSYKTPHLDQLAAGGMRFENCHSQPLCTPTRVQLMTGQYNVRNYTRFGHLDPSQQTFAHLFQQAGYATCIVGKWQLGQAPDLPRRLGFGESCLWQHTRRPPRYANPGLEIHGKPVDYTKGEYGPDLVNAHALDFIARHKDKPFLLYYPMILTHNPFQPTPDSPNYDPKAVGEKVNQHPKHFADMVAYADKLVGRLVAALEKHGLREKTFLLFTGDNGTNVNITSKMGDRTVRGGKGLTRHTGTHVPLLASWPGVVPAGRVSRDLVDSTDFLPTICAAAGIAVPADGKVDGRSFLPQLRGENGSPREWIYCWYARNGGATADREFAMNQRFKLYRDGQLFDLSLDLDEQRPLDPGALSAEATAASNQLQAVLDQFRDARPPALKSQGGKPAPKPNLPTDAKESRDRLAQQPERGVALRKDRESWLKSVVRSLNGEDYTSK